MAASYKLTGGFFVALYIFMDKHLKRDIKKFFFWLSILLFILFIEIL